jgi:hypothetical protein
MSTLKILNEDWTDYDNKKIRDKRDGKYFSCGEEWEVNHLLKKIKKHYPSHSDTEILNVIKSCCKSVAAPRPRETFIDCVIFKL